MIRLRLRVVTVEKIDATRERVTLEAAETEAVKITDRLDDEAARKSWLGSANLELVIDREDVHGAFEIGQEFFVGFTAADPDKR